MQIKRGVPIELSRRCQCSMRRRRCETHKSRDLGRDQSWLTLPKWRRNPETSISANPIRRIRRSYYCALSRQLLQHDEWDTSILPVSLIYIYANKDFDRFIFGDYFRLSVAYIPNYRSIDSKSLPVFDEISEFSLEMGYFRNF